MGARIAAVLALVAACSSDARPLEPDLDHLAAVDLGGGDSPRAWNIVFVGDGYAADEVEAYRELVDAHVAALIAHDNGFVAMAPEAFHFHRVDAVGPGWKLGTYLDRSGSCDQPLIMADRELVERAARNAVPDADVIVLLAHSLDGRPNAGVHMSDRDDWHVLEHELSHALFRLDDEYTELSWCSERTPRDEAALLATANVTALTDDAKWSGLVAGVQTGGGRWPCLHHPTSACIMGASVADAYCPVCAAEAHEMIAARLCTPDGRAPRVAWTETTPLFLSVGSSGQQLTLEAAAYDEGTLGDMRFLVDGAPLVDLGGPWLDLDLDTLAPGSHVVEAQVTDAAGHAGTSAPRIINIAHATPLAPEVSALQVNALPDGWLRVSAAATPVGGTVKFHIAGHDVTAPITSASMTVDIPGELGATTLSAIAATAGGVASLPRSAAVGDVTPTTDPPVVEAITVNGTSYTSLAITGARLEVEVRVRSCAPLDVVEATSDDTGKVLGTIGVEPDHDCQYVIRLTLEPIAGPATFIAVDRFGRSGHLSIALPPIADVAAICRLEPSVDAPVIALARPAEIAFGRAGATIISGAVAVDAAPAATFQVSRADGTRGALLAARDVPGPPRDGTVVPLSVTVVGQCAGGLAATTAIVPVTVDAIAPSLRVHRFTRAGVPLHVETDASSVETIVRGDTTIVRAIDAAGNVTQREVVPIVFPYDRAGCTTP